MHTGNDSLLDALLKTTQVLYLSDLRKLELRAKLVQKLEEISASAYLLREWNDAVGYILPGSPTFETQDAAKQYLVQGLGGAK